MEITKGLRNILIILILIIITIGQHIIISYGVIQEERPKVVMLIVNRVDFHDLYNLPQMKSLIDNSSIALMNTRSSGGNNEFKSYATLGWGTRAEASQNTSTFFDLQEETLAIFKRRAGNLGEENGIVNIDINALLQQNIRGEYGAIPGALGSLLRKHGYKTAVIGNSDIEDQISRAAGLIAMDQKGYIDDGNISDNMIEKDYFSPYGVKTNYDLLLKTFNEIYPKGDFIVIETGDTNRLDKYKDKLNKDMYEYHKNNILNRIDNLIKNILVIIDTNNTIFMIITPYPSDYAAVRGERLTPIIIYDGGLNKGLLWSGTTRRKGIIGNVDVAPTILSYFNIKSQNMVGREVKTVIHDDPINYINKLNRRIVNTSLQRYRVLYSFAVFQILASCIALLSIIFRKRISRVWQTPILLLLLSTIVAPFTLLILPLLGELNIFLNYLLLVGITGGIVYTIYSIRKGCPLIPLMIASFLVMIGLIIDIALGQNLIKNSLLGYDPIIGARYYGIGNEYMGVLIGSTLLFTTILIERYKVNKYIIIAFYSVTVAVIALPTLGANVGGTITAVVAFVFTSIRLLGMKIDARKLLTIIVFVVIIVVMIAIIDIFVMENQTHLANAFRKMADQGPIVIYEIITRKIAMNIRIMGVTVWSKVLLSAIVIMGILFYRPVGVIKKVASTYPKVSIGWSGIIVACVIAFAVNDSGVVAAATTIIYLSTSMLFLILKKEEEFFDRGLSIRNKKE